MLEKVELTCESCGQHHLVSAEACAQLKVGDAPYKDPRNPEFGKCKRCRKRKLVVTRVPFSLPPEKPRGFWKVPTDGSSSDTTTESSQEPKE